MNRMVGLTKITRRRSVTLMVFTAAYLAGSTGCDAECLPFALGCGNVQDPTILSTANWEALRRRNDSVGSHARDASQSSSTISIPRGLPTRSHSARIPLAASCLVSYLALNFIHLPCMYSAASAGRHIRNMWRRANVPAWVSIVELGSLCWYCGAVWRSVV